MDTLKYENCKYVIISLILIFSIVSQSFADQLTAVEVLRKSYKIKEPLSKSNAQEVITQLESALQNCSDKNIEYRIKYRTGILRFKSSDLEAACKIFNQICQAQGCPPTIKLCSLNMAAQIYLMQGDPANALKAFESVIETSTNFFQRTEDKQASSIYSKLTANAYTAKAEIYLHQGDCNIAMTEYQKLAGFFEGREFDQKRNLEAVLLDKISQLYLIKGRSYSYIKAANKLIKYPDYYRTGLIKLEIEAATFLMQKKPSLLIGQPAFRAPVILIEFLKENRDKALLESTLAFLNKLSNSYQQSFSGAIIDYHIACLLDGFGERVQACELFEKVYNQAAEIDIETSQQRNILSNLSNYAKLQHALILCESGKYKHGLKVLSKLETGNADCHISKTKESIEYSLQILKREVPNETSSN